MNKVFLCCLLVFMVSCYTEAPEEEEKAEKVRAERRLSAEVTPVMEDYFEDCRDGDFKGVVGSYSIELIRELEIGLGSVVWSEMHVGKKQKPKVTFEKLRELGHPLLIKYHQDIKEDLKIVGDTARVVSIKHHGYAYAIVEVEYSKGKQFIAMIRQDNTWKIHMVSDSHIVLISSIPA